MVQALSPQAVAEAAAKGLNIPAVVVEAVNALLLRNASSNRIVLKQREVVAEVQTRTQVTTAEIYANKWLDFEPYYRAAGWQVEYDKPAYCESYEPYFIFTSP